MAYQLERLVETGKLLKIHSAFTVTLLQHRNLFIYLIVYLIVVCALGRPGNALAGYLSQTSTDMF